MRLAPKKHVVCWMTASWLSRCNRTSTTRVRLRRELKPSAARTSVTPTSCKSHPVVDYCIMLTCSRALKNYQQSPLLKLPPELLNKVYEYVFDDQVMQVMVMNGQLRLVNAGLPSTSRKLYQDTGDFPYTKTTVKIVTFKFISQLDSWQFPILTHLDEFLDALDSIPAGIAIARFEIVGVMEGFDGIEAMTTRSVAVAAMRARRLARRV